MPRTGRPKSENPKDNRVSVRLNRDLFTKLEEYCKKHEAERAETMRIALEKFLENEK